MKSTNQTVLTAKDLALYLGCKVMAKLGTREKTAILRGIICYEHTEPKVVIFTIETQDKIYSDVREVKPILRRLESMTEEEKKEFRLTLQGQSPENILPVIPAGRLINWYHSALSVNVTIWLISKSFDLFGWIDSGLALDQDSLKPKE